MDCDGCACPLDVSTASPTAGPTSSPTAGPIPSPTSPPAPSPTPAPAAADATDGGCKHVHPEMIPGMGAFTCDDAAALGYSCADLGQIGKDCDGCACPLDVPTSSPTAGPIPSPTSPPAPSPTPAPTAADATDGGCKHVHPEMIPGMGAFTCDDAAALGYSCADLGQIGKDCDGCACPLDVPTSSPTAGPIPSPTPAPAAVDGGGSSSGGVGGGAATICVLRDKTVCWGNEHRYIKQTGSAGPFDDIDSIDAGPTSPIGAIDVGGLSAPTFADLDDDGDLDLVVGELDGALYYYKNVGSATSPGYVPVSGAASPFDGINVGYQSSPVFVDLDDDGDLDLVVGDGVMLGTMKGGTLNYYENVGSATSPTYLVTGTTSPFDSIGDVWIMPDGSLWSFPPNSKPAFGDVDDDSDLDLVVGGQGANFPGLVYYENVGSAALPTYVVVFGTDSPFDGVEVDTESGLYYNAPALADLDGDGDLDLVVGEWEGLLFYYENVGSAASPSYVVVTGSERSIDGIVGSSSAPAFGDLDDDGDLDLVVGEQHGTLYYYENVGNATSPSYEAVAGTASPFDGIDVGYQSAPAFVDLDGDLDLDLVVGFFKKGELDGGLHYYENVGSAASPTYAAVTGTTSPFDGFDVASDSRPEFGSSDSRPAFGDLDGDGDLDFVLGRGSLLGGFFGELEELLYYENVGNATSPSYVARTDSASPFDGIDAWSAPTFADLDGDGDLDLVVGHEPAVGEGYGFLNYYENVGSAASPSYVPVTGSASPFDGVNVGTKSAPAFADLDGDGDLDLVVGEEDGGLDFEARLREIQARRH
ncbi:hypothetical protein SO694_00005650 [Aureococcus anophagefferens]|uniref:Uncharacterized protein n=1 Tax=Aureococcus anophagefferens TaxID=44056 RepID=A0ABR1G9E2_AURAN